ncbi:NIPSNAP family protein [Devosia naphthalenivorans]|uniref:NIPSNAP family protein n=1 Tax=Devosia naphthalenivorans TaxID=2082392 RepID=UPI000D37300A|nr:NIPSNAP family protein [Devosia naphthalenivorans]
MIVELREYTLHPEHTVQDYLSLYERDGLELQRAALGTMLGYYVVEIGQLNQIVHMWGYESFDDRAARRRELAAKPQWRAFLRQVRPMLANMSNRIMLPTSFSPVPLGPVSSNNYERR